MILATRRAAISALVLALGNACATSEDPEVEVGLGGQASAGSPMVTAGTAGAPAPVGGSSGSAALPGGAGSGAQAGEAEAGAGSGGSGPGGAAAGGTGSGAAGSASGGKSGGAGGGGAGGTAEAGQGGAKAGAAGAPPSGGIGGASAGSGGKSFGGGTGGGALSGGSGGGSSAGTCDWDAAKCEQLTCAKACPTNDGGYCATACSGIITCVEKALPRGCATTSDPMCVRRKNGAANECSTPWETAGGSTTSGPSKNAVLYFECACGVNVQ